MAFWGGYPPYVSVAARRAKAMKYAKSLEKGGRRLAPVAIKGRDIATTFWGKSWCENLAAYSDYESRLPRGRTYARNGSVIDLQIARNSVTALVSGSEVYTVTVKVKALPAPRWKQLTSATAAETLSMIDILAGSFSEQVMQRFCSQDEGLFPAPHEIDIDCTCPDWADLCKHVAAVFYGIGARLDSQPELLFTLRAVDPLDLVGAASAAPAKARKLKGAKVVANAQLSSVFGIDLGGMPAAAPKKSAAKSAAKPAARSKAKASTPKAKPKKAPARARR